MDVWRLGNLLLLHSCASDRPRTDKNPKSTVSDASTEAHPFRRFHASLHPSCHHSSKGFATLVSARLLSASAWSHKEHVAKKGGEAEERNQQSDKEEEDEPTFHEAAMLSLLMHGSAIGPPSFFLAPKPPVVRSILVQARCLMMGEHTHLVLLIIY
ncbi:hypothetical protein MUK42_32666 [Musa troglodytarum]|uniref:Uncharacterized protein n=1 Tax=Musa troglodytarum TaxID=320322 RepID=A0A9E7FFA9_9LILI|nr:hypothetical protein MUK42_32666 [Musa troglodytarum]